MGYGSIYWGDWFSKVIIFCCKLQFFFQLFDRLKWIVIKQGALGFSFLHNLCKWNKLTYFCFFGHGISYGVSVTYYVSGGNQLGVVQRDAPWRWWVNWYVWTGYMIIIKLVFFFFSLLHWTSPLLKRSFVSVISMCPLLGWSYQQERSWSITKNPFMLRSPSPHHSCFKKVS